MPVGPDQKDEIRATTCLHDALSASRNGPRHRTYDGKNDKDNYG
jgi:hypothetical protein